MSKVILKKGKEKIVDQRHQWIFSGAIDTLPEQFENGSLLPFYSFQGEHLGAAYFNRHSSLTGRIISFGSDDPLDILRKNVRQAFTLRKNLFDDRVTNSYRIINAEGDLVPGLIVDRYGDYLVLQIGTLGMEKLKSIIIDTLLSLYPFKGIYEKSTSSTRSEEKMPPFEGILRGEIPETVAIVENGLCFNVSIISGQKTGFFLDQREMRSLLGSLSHKKKVLNCFSYTGGFTLYALKHGASIVDSLDISEKAIAMAKNNLHINGLEIGNHRFLTLDVFQFLREQQSLDYDIVILDPPAFAKKKKDVEQATIGYREINWQVISKIKKNGLLITCSCSYFMEESLFKTLLFQAAKKAKRNVKILSSHRQSFDHPINIYHRENDYLKSFLVHVE